MGASLRHILCVLLAALVVAGSSRTARAQDTSQEQDPGKAADARGAGEDGEEEEKRPVISASADDVIAQIEDVVRDRYGLFKKGPISLFAKAWNLWRGKVNDKIGLEVGFAFTAVYQGASDAPFGDKQAGGGDMDIFGRWALLGRDGPNTGTLGFALEWRMLLFQDIAAADLSRSIGSLWKTTNGFNTKHFTLNQIWWEQKLFDGHVTVTFGSLMMKNYFHANRLKNDNKSFLNQAFSGDPALPFPSRAPGVVVDLRFGDWYVRAGVVDASGATEGGFKALDADNFSAFEVGWTPLLQGKWIGHYRLTWWNLDPSEGQEANSGLAISIDQAIQDGVIFFITYERQDTNRTGTRQLLSIGFGVDGPLGQLDDFMGVGFAWGAPFDDTLADQFVLEFFYRIHVSPAVEITPGIQWVFAPSLNPQEQVIAIFQIRIRISF